MVVAIIGIILIIAILPQLITLLNLSKTQSKTDEEIKEEKLAQDMRDEKGALGNTVDFIFGEGASKDIATELNRDIITGKTENELRVELLEKSASEKLGTQVTFPESTTIEKDTGIVRSDTSPTFELTEAEIIIIQNRQMKEKQIDEAIQITTSFERQDRPTRF